MTVKEMDQFTKEEIKEIAEDYRLDLVNFYGYTPEQVNNMTNEQVILLTDEIDREK